MLILQINYVEKTYLATISVKGPTIGLFKFENEVPKKVVALN